MRGLVPALLLAAAGTGRLAAAAGIPSAAPVPPPSRLADSAESWSAVQREVLYRFAPILVQESHSDPEKRRRDFPIRADFDGDRRGDNNEENLAGGRHPLEAAAYAALLETSTHWFLTYSFFHALDWSRLPPWVPYAWHENDMESVQVVVRKGAGLSEAKVDLVAAQAHLGTAFAVPAGSGIAGSALEKTRALLLDSAFGDGDHVCIRSEMSGHGLHILAADLTLKEEAGSGKKRKSMILRPADREGGHFHEDGWDFTYRLHSTHETFWRPFLRGEDIGNGKLMDGRFDYEGGRRSRKGVPRHFDSDRWSSWGKRDAGILPFAFSHKLTAKDLGELFFDPAWKYPALFSIPDEWSRTYLHHPYPWD